MAVAKTHISTGDGFIDPTNVSVYSGTAWIGVDSIRIFNGVSWDIVWQPGASGNQSIITGIGVDEWELTGGWTINSTYYDWDPLPETDPTASFYYYLNETGFTITPLETNPGAAPGHRNAFSDAVNNGDLTFGFSSGGDILPATVDIFIGNTSLYSFEYVTYANLSIEFGHWQLDNVGYNVGINCYSTAGPDPTYEASYNTFVHDLLHTITPNTYPISANVNCWWTVNNQPVTWNLPVTNTQANIPTPL